MLPDRRISHVTYLADCHCNRNPTVGLLGFYAAAFDAYPRAGNEDITGKGGAHSRRRREGFGL